jgi:hypothetical protein
MRKFLLLGMICLMGCHKSVASSTTCEDGSCSVPHVALPIPEARDTLVQENWLFSVPSGGWTQDNNLIPDAAPSPEIKLVLINDSKNCIVLFVKEKTNNNFSEYILGNVQTFGQKGNTVNYVKQVIINDNKFVEVQIDRASATLWVWLTAKDGFGYGFSCGGNNVTDAGTELQDLCHNISETLEIKE